MVDEFLYVVNINSQVCHVFMVYGVFSSRFFVLFVGMTYYTNTLGDILSGGAFFGRDTAFYAEDSATNTIVTLEGKVGVATAEI